MASEQSPLPVIRSLTSIHELHEIWIWNVKTYGVSHADGYLRFLEDSKECEQNVYPPYAFGAGAARELFFPPGMAFPAVPSATCKTWSTLATK